ncbi:MAG: MOSC domain-containing protein [Candidatus Aminicenantes bacterium]
MKFKVEAVCISEKRGQQKKSIEEAELAKNFGIIGDAHAGHSHRQVSFLAAEDIEGMKAQGLDLEPGDFAENIVTRGIDWSQVKVGGKVFIGEAEMEVTQIGKDCPKPCAIYYKAGRCIMPERGVFVKVNKGGTIHAGNRGHYRIR